MILEELRFLVRVRAGRRCEYCHLPEDYSPFAAFHIERVIAKQHKGTDAPSNLALACHHCNWRKGPNLTGIDPVTQRVVSSITRGVTNGLITSCGLAPC